MTITLDKTSDRAITKKITLEEFLVYDDDTETLYEFEDGEIILMASESETNRRIASFLFACFLQQGVPSYRLSMKTEIITTGSRMRIPDLVIFSEELASVMKGANRSIVMPEMPAPALVVEVVSPNQSDRDYRYKRSEYAARGITEYWIVDPLLLKVTVLEWVEGFYEEKVYEGEQVITSILFPELKLTTVQVFQS
ncbi:MAG: Uma2 family endonuclease [Pseudanabaena sp. CAN_BIN31]|nr:Uma2 family endonuclease [Pseudanabaena sp. CAN_BIN31]